MVWWLNSVCKYVDTLTVIFRSKSGKRINTTMGFFYRLYEWYSRYKVCTTFIYDFNKLVNIQNA